MADILWVIAVLSLMGAAFAGNYAIDRWHAEDPERTAVKFGPSVLVNWLGSGPSNAGSARAFNLARVLALVALVAGVGAFLAGS
jgi:hypothetical protein